jgi:hypothetical protein
MPTYEFANKETGEITEIRLKIAELQQYKEDHPELELCVSESKVGDPVSLGVRRIDPGFRDVLNRIADRTPGGKGLKSQIR